MNWSFIEPLQNQNLITEFENFVGYKFCESFKTCVINFNGGLPEKEAFYVDEREPFNEKVIKTFLSFNKDSKESIWRATEWDNPEQSKIYVPFAIDNFGNLICFNKQNNSVVFIDLDRDKVYTVANNFDSFMESLVE